MEIKVSKSGSCRFMLEVDCDVCVTIGRIRNACNNTMLKVVADIFEHGLNELTSKHLRKET